MISKIDLSNIDPSHRGAARNRPLKAALLMLSGSVLLLPVGAAAYVAHRWHRECGPRCWEASHYVYHVRTAWYAALLLIAGIGGFLLVVGILILMALPAWVLMRSVVPLRHALRREAIPRPHSRLI
ncbi:MAG: hypothetical protein V2J26_02590 [Pacificimonas sp.]|jgi:uncharacterized membrane protein|nr:hypothetical protein [Pacificimonas sp.]